MAAGDLKFNLDIDTSTAVAALNGFFNTYSQNAAKAGQTLNNALGQKLEKEVVIVLKDDKPFAKLEQNAEQASAKLGRLGQALNGSFANTPRILKQQVDLLQSLQQNTAKYSRKTGEVTAEWKKLEAAIKAAKDKMATFGPGPLGQLGNALQGVIGKFVAVQTVSNLATGAIQGLIAGLGQAFKSGMEMEVLVTQLEIFTGGAKQAEAAMARFVDIAVKTPFNVQQIAEAAKIIIGYGVSADKAVQATERLAIAGGATGAQMNNLARNLGQIQSQGRAYTRDLTQFAIQGIPIWEALSQVTGKSVEQLKKMAQDGAISFDMVNGAIAAVTKEGTALWQISEKLQNTMTGRFEAVASSIQLAAGAFMKMIQSFDDATGIVSGLFNITKGALQGLAAIFKMLGDNMKTVVPIVGALVVGITSFFAIAKWGAVVAGIKMAIDAMKALKIVQAAVAAWQIVINALAGPAGWANIAAAIGLGAAAYVGLNIMIDKHSEARAKEAEKLKTAAEALKNVQERQKELIDQYGLIEGKTMSFGEQLTALEKAYKNGEISAADYAKRLATLRDEMAALMPAAETAKQKIEEVDKALKKLKDQKTKADKYFKDQLDGIEKNKKAEDDRHKKEKANIDQTKQGIEEKTKVAIKGIDERKAKEDEFHSAVNRAIDTQGRKLQENSDADKRNIEDRKNKVQEESDAKINSLQRSAATEDAFHEKAMSQIRARSEAAINALEREKQKSKERYDSQIEALEALGPAEQKLAAMRMQELQARARDGNLTEKERLEAQAQLERMAKQQQIAELKKKQKEEEMAYEAKISAEKEKQTQLEEEQNLKHQKRLESIQQSIAAEQKHAQEKLKALDEEAKRKEEEYQAEQKRLEAKKQGEADRHERELAALEAEKEAVNEKKEADLKGLEERGKAEDEYHEKVKEQYEAQKEQVETAKKNYQEFYDKRKEQLENIKQGIKEEGKAVEDTRMAVEKLRDMYQQVVDKIKLAIIEQNKLNAAAGRQKTAPTAEEARSPYGGTKAGAPASPGRGNPYTGEGRASGGPVAGGSVYTVNELGQEAFLSAAGRLSMINAPSWGQWRAPGAGTVIPAHITSNLAIPSGGVKVNTGAGSRAGAGSTGLAAAVNKLGAMMSPGNVVNNVSVQSTNPTKTASDMLVQLTKVRRNRYS